MSERSQHQKWQAERKTTNTQTGTVLLQVKTSNNENPHIRKETKEGKEKEHTKTEMENEHQE
jgi:hypothetical protein